MTNLNLTDFGAARAVLAGLGKAVSATSGMYIGLLTALPASPDTATLADFAGNEITAISGYSRQAVDWETPAGSPPLTANDADVDFGPFGDDPPEVAAAFLTDTSTGTSGNVMAYWNLDTPRDVGVGDHLRFFAGNLTETVD